LPCRNGDRQRVGAKQQIETAERCDVICAANGGHQADHVGFGNHVDIQRCRPGMVAVAYADPSNAALPRLFNGKVRRPVHREMTQAIIAVKYGCRGIIRDDLYVRAGIVAAVTQAVHVLPQAKRTMRVVAQQVRLGHQARNDVGVCLRHVKRLQGRGKERRKVARLISGFRSGHGRLPPLEASGPGACIVFNPFFKQADQSGKQQGEDEEDQRQRPEFRELEIV